MATFNYQDYQNVVAQAQNGATSRNLPRVGFFKLAKDGDQALVRFNISSVNDFQFATVHKPIYGKKFEGLSNPYAGVSCINEVGNYSVENCPLCKAASENHPVVGKADKMVYIQMLVSYKDMTSGTWSEPVAVVWERKASYSRELATKLQTYGDLKNVLFTMTRMGAGKETRYILDYAVPTIFKPEMVPADFTVFDGFKVNKHSYYEKTVDEINTYLTTGSFPEVVKADTMTQSTSTPVYTAPAQPTYSAPVTPTPTASAPATPTEQPQGADARPQRNFTVKF